VLKRFACCLMMTAVLPLCQAQPTSDDSSPRSLSELVSVLRDYRQALAERNTTYLAKHTLFPMSYAEADLDMEAKALARRIGTVAELLRIRENLIWPEAVAPATVDALVSLKQGTEKCSDAAHPDIPDWQKGAPAFDRRGDVATITYLASPCEAATHRVTLRFDYLYCTWWLRERAIRLGTH
jgi:hypothetical protein